MKTNKITVAKADAAATAKSELPAPGSAQRAQAVAQLALRPSVNAALVMQEFAKGPLGEQDPGALVDEISDGIRKMHDGDMSVAEAMLLAQAQALQSMFMNLARRAARQDRPEHMEALLRMALKSQNQCRMTLETLATVKNPPIVIARQANINNGGQQQVNNGTAAAGDAATTAKAVKPRTCTRAAKNQTRQIELLEVSHEQRLDAGTTGAAGGADPHLAALEAGHRAAHRGRQGRGRP